MPDHSRCHGVRYHWGIVPCPRRFPKDVRHWYRVGALVLVPVLAAGLLPVFGWFSGRVGCRPGAFYSGDVWRQDGECVGVSDGPYAFGVPQADAVMRMIARQNEAAPKGSCAKGAEPVTVGVLMTLTSPDAQGRAIHQLEGTVAAQAAVNQDKSGCLHPVHLRVGQMGANEQAAVKVAAALARSDDLVAVVGMGLSAQQSADAARVLARHRVPMVAPVITAEGFDRNGSVDDRPDFSGCDPRHTFKDGVGQGFFYRLGHRQAVQVDRLAAYFAGTRRGRLTFILTPISVDDPYTCTLVPLLHRRFGGVQEVRFDTRDPSTMALSAQRICLSRGAVNVFYAARARDLPRFLKELADQSRYGQCGFSGLTVLSTSDASRIRAPETDPNLERQRRDALTAPMVQNGTVRLVYTPPADPGVLARSGAPGFAQLRKAFGELRWDPRHLDDGWAISGYDSLATVAAAVNTLSTGRKVTPTRVNSAVGGFFKGGGGVPAASGNITFDNNGNRNDSVPVVVRLCPPRAADLPTETAQVYPGSGDCP
jgi:hypothetical protein